MGLCALPRGLTPVVRVKSQPLKRGLSEGHCLFKTVKRPYSLLAIFIKCSRPFLRSPDFRNALYASVREISVRLISRVFSHGDVSEVRNSVIRLVPIDVVYCFGPFSMHPEPSHPMGLEPATAKPTLKIAKNTFSYEGRPASILCVPGSSPSLSEMMIWPAFPNHQSCSWVVIEALTNKFMCEIRIISHGALSRVRGQGRVERWRAPRSKNHTINDTYRQVCRNISTKGRGAVGL